MNLTLTPDDLFDLAGGRGDPVLRKLVSDMASDLFLLQGTIEELKGDLAEARDRIASLTEETARWEVRIRDLEGKGPSAAVPA